MSTPRPAPQPRPQPRVKAVVDDAPRCWRCGRKIAEYAGRPWKITCERCRAMNGSPDGQSP